MSNFDLAVIGSGPGGYRAAALAALRGLKVAIVEKDAWGGCCLNRGCVPKKDWYHSARLIAASASFGGRGIRGAVPEVIYSALELARVGLDEAGAEALGYEPATGFTAFETNPAARVEDDAAGFVRVVADADTGGLLGAELAGSAAGELIHLAGIEFGAPGALAQLAALSYNHPARAEEILNAVESLAARWGLAQRIFAVRRPAAE